MITNLIVSELLISVVGVPLDLIGTVLQGRALETVLCPTTAFAHTLFGKCKLENLKYFSNCLTVFSQFHGDQY